MKRTTDRYMGFGYKRGPRLNGRNHDLDMKPRPEADGETEDTKVYPPHDEFTQDFDRGTLARLAEKDFGSYEYLRQVHKLEVRRSFWEGVRQGLFTSFVALIIVFAVFSIIEHIWLVN